MKKYTLNKFIVMLIVLFIWQLASFFYNEIVLPSPLNVIYSLRDILIKENFITIIGYSFMRTLIGLLFAISFGTVIGLFSGLNEKFNSYISPIVIFIQSMPIISWIILALIWFDNNFIPIFILIIATIPIFILNISTAILNTDKNLIEMANIYKVSKKKIMKNIYLPTIKSNFFSSLKIGSGQGFKISIMAEIIARSQNGIGEKMNWAWINIETSDIIAWSLIIVFISFFFEFIINLFLEKKL
ncbi:ABC transporter permease [Haliovirga abyssi]|uniref:ABC transporter permease n=1 Tax=Haliovirga abyssi TaxID=2996794 RepID=A0AAU9DIT5_9FUSO|nr:ABC transporter permease subunit [Haliovirga abyssi]BDU51517.1 ABC transporter permease [Haliovirga abyssi]